MCTLDYLKSSIQDMIISFGGRLSIVEIQALADIDMFYVNTIVQKVTSPLPQKTLNLFKKDIYDVVHMSRFARSTLMTSRS